MKKNNKMVAFRLKDNKSQNKKAIEIINTYYEKSLLNDGQTWYSTNNSIRNPKNIEKVIFFNNSDNEEFYYIADVVSGEKFKNKGIVNVNMNLIPELYRNEPKKIWLLIENIKKIEKEELKKYYTLKNELLFDKFSKELNSQRFNKIYFIK
ncbi:hypothetical protein H9660_14360 [Clostridium sp. Sa3CUN1]|uniref:Uncharacterized protein n=1 Tax=Clostridium gallinarum TaxID=2762246 RepID=A0ABR8Q7B9_9CLOT|nr:hypothetical protein [Clostridium gallinarum]MBD7916327.1 hypothetical protein [Clostridium gallinarum]